MKITYYLFKLLIDHQQVYYKGIEVVLLAFGFGTKQCVLLPSHLFKQPTPPTAKRNNTTTCKITQAKKKKAPGKKKNVTSKGKEINIKTTGSFLCWTTSTKTIACNVWEWWNHTDQSSSINYSTVNETFILFCFRIQ